MREPTSGELEAFQLYTFEQRSHVVESFVVRKELSSNLFGALSEETFLLNGYRSGCAHT